MWGIVIPNIKDLSFASFWPRQITVQTETRAEISQSIAQVDGAVGILKDAPAVASLVSGELGEHHVSEAAHL